MPHRQTGPRWRPVTGLAIRSLTAVTSRGYRYTLDFEDVERPRIQVKSGENCAPQRTWTSPHRSTANGVGTAKSHTNHAAPAHKVRSTPLTGDSDSEPRSARHRGDGDNAVAQFGSRTSPSQATASRIHPRARPATPSTWEVGHPPSPSAIFSPGPMGPERRCSLVVEHQLPKLRVRVRFPSPALRKPSSTSFDTPAGQLPSKAGVAGTVTYRGGHGHSAGMDGYLHNAHSGGRAGYREGRGCRAARRGRGNNRARLFGVPASGRNRRGNRMACVTAYFGKFS